MLGSKPIPFKNSFYWLLNIFKTSDQSVVAAAAQFECDNCNKQSVNRRDADLHLKIEYEQDILKLNN